MASLRPCVAVEQKFQSRYTRTKGKGSPHSITERWVPEVIPVLGSQPAGDASHKSGGRPPLLSARLAVTPAVLLLGEHGHSGCEQFA